LIERFGDLIELTFLVPVARLATAVAGFFARPSVVVVTFFAGFAAGLAGLVFSALDFLAGFGLDGGAGAAF
jgi:hypothetical protein